MTETRGSYGTEQEQLLIRRKANILNKLGDYVGKQNRTNIEEFCAENGISRRKLRDLVESINSDLSNDFQRRLILTDTDDGGYWLDDRSDPVSAARYYNSEHNRAMKTLTKVSAVKTKSEMIYGKARFAQALEEVKRMDEAKQQTALFKTNQF